jgi:hypothetical protein
MSPNFALIHFTASSIIRRKSFLFNNFTEYGPKNVPLLTYPHDMKILTFNQQPSFWFSLRSSAFLCVSAVKVTSLVTL